MKESGSEMARPAFLEPFELLETETAGQDEPSEDWLAGYGTGLVEGRASALDDQAVLSAALVQTLSDKSFGYEEARAHLMGSLRPLFAALIDTFVPDLARAMLVPHLLQELSAIAEADCSEPVTLSLAPEEAESVAAAMARAASMPFLVRSDPTILPGQATLSGSGTERAVDLAGMVRRAQSILEAHLDATEQKERHG